MLFKWNGKPHALKQTDALWELFSPKIGKFFKTEVLTLGNDILTMTPTAPDQQLNISKKMTTKEVWT